MARHKIASTSTDVDITHLSWGRFLRKMHYVQEWGTLIFITVEEIITQSSKHSNIEYTLLQYACIWKKLILKYRRVYWGTGLEMKSVLPNLHPLLPLFF
jgi:hypothetical protein